MANFRINKLIKKRQLRTSLSIGSLILIVLVAVITVMADAKPKKRNKAKQDELAGIIEESFTKSLGDHALTEQQAELASLKKEMAVLQKNITEQNKARAKENKALTEELKTTSQALLQELHNASSKKSEEKPKIELAEAKTLGFWHTATDASPMDNTMPYKALTRMDKTIHAVLYKPKKRSIKQSHTYLDARHFVPANTTVRAVVLGGADANASVTAQSQNNDVMLFKLLEDGRLPNGARAPLRGCRVSAKSFGDISSERAYPTLYKITCARFGEPIIEKKVTGWIFHKGKVGIKGRPVMRDGKIVMWAGVSGALSGIADAAQYAQSVQQFGAYGASSVVPSGNIGAYAGFGGASKAASVLSQYYIKRAEQYHPIIPVGAGNEVTVVFEDGFFLEPEEAIARHVSVLNTSTQKKRETHLESSDANELAEDASSFSVPPEVLNRIDSTNRKSRQLALGASR